MKRNVELNVKHYDILNKVAVSIVKKASLKEHY